MTSFTIRLTLRFVILVTGTTAVVLAVGGWLLDRQMLRGLELLHHVEFEEVRPVFEGAKPLSTEAIAKAMLEESESDATLYFFQVHNVEGTVLFRSPNLGDAILPNPTAPAQHWTTEVAGIGPVRISEYRIGHWQIQVASALAPTRRLLRDYVRVAGILVVMIGIVSVGLGYSFSRFTLKPVRAIEQTARQIGGHNLSERIPEPSARDELSDLVMLLNEMFNRLEASFVQVKRFTADASHELKTPLALIRLNAEKLRSIQEDHGEARDLSDEMLEDIESLQRIIESLLFLAKAESGSFAPAMTEVDAAELVRSFSEDATALAEDRGVVFTVERSDSGRVRCETTLMRQVLLNLVQNAVREVPAGGRVTLESIVDDGKWQLVVTDEGTGVAQEQLGLIFERFVHFRGVGEKNEREGRHGLGLAICRGIVGLHGGRIDASNRRDRPGLRVVVELPNPENRL